MMLNNLKIADKLSLIVLSFVLPILILLYLLIQTHQWRIDFAQKEIAGNHYLIQIRQIQEKLQQYHLDANLYTPQNKVAQTTAIETALQQLANESQQQIDILNIDSQVRALHNRYNSFLYDAKANKINQSSDNLHNLEQELKTTITVVGDESNLILDPDLDSYYLANAALLEIPKQVDLLIQTLLLVEPFLKKSYTLSLDEKVQIIALLGKADSSSQTLFDGLELAIKHNQQKYQRKHLIAASLKKTLQNSREKVQALLKRLKSDVVETDIITITYSEIRLMGQTAIAAQFILWDSAVIELNSLLQERIYELNKIKYAQLISVIIVLLLSFSLCVKIVRAITLPLWHAQTIMAELARGNLELSVDSGSDDETGKLLSGIGLVLASLRGIVFQILAATQKLISTFHELSKRSELILAESDRIKVDSSLIVNESTIITKSVNDNVQQLQKTSDKITTLAAAIEQLSISINTISYNSDNSSRNMSAVTHNIEQVSTNIYTLSASAQQMTAALSAISDSAKETNQISTQANENAKELLGVMNELHTSSERIGKIVKLISHIAAKTNMLSLNATIEAATAGDAGKGFAVVASEIKNLAQQTISANNEIAEQIFQVQSHIQKALSNTQTVSGVVSRVAIINHQVELSISEEYQCANEISHAICLLADASKDASFNTKQAEQGLWEITRAVNEAFITSKEVAANVEQGNQELRAVTKRSMASLEQLNSVNLHIASIKKSIESIHEGNQHLYAISQQTAKHIDGLKESVAIFHLNAPATIATPNTNVLQWNQ